MRKITLIIILSLSSFFLLSGQKLVYDKAKDYQIKSMVFQQWKFHPEWYYYYVWYPLEIPTPGLGLHDAYANRYAPKMNILYLTPTLAESEISEGYVRKADKEYETIYEQELVKFVDRTIDAEYLLIKDDLDFIKTLINNEMGKFFNNNVTADNAEPLYKEYARINGKLDILKDSHLENAKRRKAYQDIEKNFQKLHMMCISINKINKHSNVKDYNYE